MPGTVYLELLLILFVYPEILQADTAADQLSESARVQNYLVYIKEPQNQERTDEHSEEDRQQQLEKPEVHYEQVPVKVPSLYPVRVPYPIRVPYPVPVAVKVPYIIYRKVEVPVEKKVPLTIEKPYPVEVIKKVPFAVPKPYAVPVLRTRKVYYEIDNPDQKEEPPKQRNQENNQPFVPIHRPTSY